MDDELARVTLAHLRRAEAMCRRRLAREHAGLHGNWSPPARFAVANRLVEDARVAHAELRAPLATDFPSPSDLVPEQQLLYRAAAGGYVALFAQRPARAVVVDAWETELADLEVRLVGSLGLALETADGSPELRSLRLGVAGNRPLIDDAERRVLVVRSATWVGERPLRIVVVDLLEGAVVETEIDVAAAHPEALEWVAARVAVVRARAASPIAKAGADCRGCPFVPGCPAHAA
ncbi:MAG TPA: hypothetical protein VIK61_20170 [Acidimicrobiia bacterium]